MNINLSTKANITWCPGCPDSAILVAFRQVITELIREEKVKLENVVVVSGVGCHGKISDYLNVNTFNSLHGRLVPFMTGVKVANPKLQVFGFSGDGDSYAEGIAHLVHAARRNSDINLFVHNNQVFALTTGQATPTTPKGFKGKSTPYGSIEEPFNPLLLMLSVGATFVARTYAGDINKTKEIMKAAAAHKGFSFVDIIQPCITFFDTRKHFQEHTFWLEDKFPRNDVGLAMEMVRQDKGKIPLGVFYNIYKPIFEQQVYE